MEEVNKKSREHAFSIELNSKQHVKRVAVSDHADDNVLIEGFLGELKEMIFIDGVMLEMKGTNGILRMDLKEEELRTMLKSE